MWQYKIFKEVAKEPEWRKLRRKCPYYESTYEWCSELNDFCSFHRCPLRTRALHMEARSPENPKVTLRKGSLLERDVARLFRLVGLNPQLNVKLNNYEIDVLVVYQGRRIAVECKQYERASLTVRNLIHEWHSKSEELGLKVILILVGIKVKPEDLELAERYGIVIWDEEKFDKLFNEAIESREAVRDKILLDVGIEPIEGYDKTIKELAEKYRPLLHPLKVEPVWGGIAGMWLLLGWLPALFIAAATPLTWDQMISVWFAVLVTLIVIHKFSASRRRKKMSQGLLHIMFDLSKIRKTVLTEELTYVSGLPSDEIEETLRWLEKTGKVRSLHGGLWELVQGTTSMSV